MTRKLGQPYSFVRQPRGYERQRILDSYYQKTNRRHKPSLPAAPSDLMKVQGSMNTLNFNWLFISVWLGLRPQEIDNLHDEKKMWKIEILPTGRKIIWIFQTKIIALPPEDRWKPIPILFDEQQFALKMISDKNFKRPLVKTIRKISLQGGSERFQDACAMAEAAPDLTKEKHVGFFRAKAAE